MPREVAALVSNARLHLEQGLADEALLEAEEAAASSREGGNVQGYRDALDLVCKSHIALGRPTNASQAATKELVTVMKFQDKTFETVVLLTHAETLLATNCPEEAVQKAMQAAEKATALQEKAWHFSALEVESDALLAVGALSEAKVATEQLTIMAEQLQDKNKEGRALQKLASACYSLGDSVEAIKAANQAFSKYQMAGNRSGEAVVLELQARINLWGLDRSAEARRVAQTSVALARETGDIAVVDMALATLIHVYIVQDKKSEALRIAQQELSKVRQGTAKGREFAAWERLMNTFFEMGDDAAARKSAQDGLASCAKVGETEMAAMQVAAARLYLKLGMADDALNAAQQAWTSYRRIGDAAGVAMAVQALTDIKITRGEVPPKSVARELALAQLKELAKAVQTKSLKDFSVSMERLTALGSISQRDIDAVLVPVFQEDRAGAMEMIEAYAEVAHPHQGSAVISERLAELVSSEKKNAEAANTHAETFVLPQKPVQYLVHYLSGMGFGPRFQVNQLTAGMVTGKQKVAMSASRIEHPEGDPHDWESGLMLHPGMIDSAIHNGSSLNLKRDFNDIVKVKGAA